MATITVWNKGKREWTTIKDANGQFPKWGPQASIEMDEAAGLKLVMAYPREFSTTGIAGPSSSDLARQEQSLRDRTANLDKREKALEEREAAVKAREDALKPNPRDIYKGIDSPETDKPRRGRPAKTSDKPGDGKPETSAEAD